MIISNVTICFWLKSTDSYDAVAQTCLKALSVAKKDGFQSQFMKQSKK